MLDGASKGLIFLLKESTRWDEFTDIVMDNQGKAEL